MTLALNFHTSTAGVVDAPPVSTTPVASLSPTTLAINFPTGTAGVVDTGVKFATGVNDTGSKFATCVNDTGGKEWEQYQNTYT
jgi:hypothetical protein